MLRTMALAAATQLRAGARAAGRGAPAAPRRAAFSARPLRGGLRAYAAAAEPTSSLVARIGADMKAAMKAKEAAKLDAIRFLNAALKQREIELREKGGVLVDAEVVGTIQKLAKQRRDSIESYQKGGRDDLVAKEQAELELLEGYLPPQLSEAELRALVSEAVSEVGATTAKQMGAVMKVVQAKAAGRADNKLVSSLVKEALQG
ncbi:glutamyl-tRNA amidotransferase [Raphidocelis subcapitata]|uniref:Glutamyl-tRNA amidotransferase n=1 Tax=Raphidocelis subcapitata TaxID=307507 RepID=A0A2V0NY56_9CHLO|nr:glutamyl-tRNA amidotransferase [Raphidocelis subcapitata]|eukprot:GBF92269.1 glutamyl-tRNA amidotransferase [Raphidocelis subcapitata]